MNTKGYIYSKGLCILKVYGYMYAKGLLGTLKVD